MRTAVEEINDRLSYYKDIAEGRPIDTLSDYKKAAIYRCRGWDYYAIYIYEVALGVNKKPEDLLKQMEAMSELAALAYEPKILALELTFLAKLLLSEDVTDIARQIITFNIKNLNEDAGPINPIFRMISCLVLKENPEQYLEWFRKRESAKYSSVLPGSSQAIAYLINRDETNLALTLDEMLLVHHKKSNRKSSNGYGSFFSLYPFLIVELAEYLGMNIRSKITQNKQVLKLGLFSPADLPDIPKNHRMPVEVDYLTAKTNLANTI